MKGVNSSVYLVLLMGAALFILLSGCSNPQNEATSFNDRDAQLRHLVPILQQFAQQLERDRQVSQITSVMAAFEGLNIEETDDAKFLSKSSVPQQLAELLCVIEVTAIADITPERHFSQTCNSFSHPNIPKMLQRFAEFSASYAAFSQRQLNVYHSDDSQQLLAYELRGSDERVYVVVNFSFDTLPIPFPHGFMTSTKVTLWESQLEETRSFVTQWPLSIQPFSAVIIVV